MLVCAKQTVAIAENVEKQQAEGQRPEHERNDQPAKDVAIRQSDEQQRGGGMRR